MTDTQFKIDTKKRLDSRTGRTYSYMNIYGKKAIRPYVTQQHWNAGGTKFYVGNDETQTIYEFNIDTEEIKELDSCDVGGSADAMATPQDYLFYRKPNNEIWKVDLNTYALQKVADAPKLVTNLGVIQVTNDGRYLTSYWKEQNSDKDFVEGKNRIRIIPRLDCEKGEWDSETLTHEFDEDIRFPDAGHPIINPVYENLLFFCHEGTTEHIPDRLWIGDFQTGESRNLFLQAECEDGKTGETSGHEVWASDGEQLFFVKYTRSTNRGQSGLVRIDKDGSHRMYINNDYLYWHCYPSRDKNWVVADTQIPGGRAEIVLVHVPTGKSHLLCNFYFPPDKPHHPYQPHPIISPDGKKVSWQMVDENGILGCAWMDISDIVDAQVDGGTQEISKGVSYVSYKGLECEVEATAIADFDDKPCFRVPFHKAMYVLLDKKGANKPVTVRLTYYDVGFEPIQIVYTALPQNNKEYADRENKIISIDRTHTCKWMTKDIVMPDINLEKPGKYGSDIKINGYFTEVYIKQIKLL